MTNVGLDLQGSYIEKPRQNVSYLRRVLAGSTAIGLACLYTSSVSAQVGSDPTVEVVAVTGQVVNGVTIGDFAPVIIGEDGDLLFFSNPSFTASFEGAFLNFGNSLNVINGFPLFGITQSPVNYTIGEFGEFSLITSTGLFGGFFNDLGNAGFLPGLNTEINNIYPGGLPGSNISTGAQPLIFGDQHAILISHLDAVAAGDPALLNRTSSLFVSNDNGATFSFISSAVNPSSLRFSGEGQFFFSEFNFLTSANSGRTDRLFSTTGVGTNPSLFGPQSGDGTFAGFNFFGVGVPLTGGLRFIDNNVSRAGNLGAYLLDNVGAGLDGLPGADIVTQGLFIQDLTTNQGQLVLLEGFFDNTTTIGNVRFENVQNVVVAANGDVFFEAAVVRDNDTNQVVDVRYWRVTNAGLANQVIKPLLSVGDTLLGADETLFPGGVTVVGFDVGVNFGLGRFDIGTTILDGRPQFLSINGEGRAATVVEINTPGGRVRALIAQDNNGDFYLVAFEGQEIEVDGVVRTVSTFQAHFGSNDIDGFGDTFNIDEQLGFIVNFTDATQAVLRVSLNGFAPGSPVTNFLWRGDCGTNEFSTICTTRVGAPATNFVDGDDTDVVAEELPDAAANVRIVQADVIISAADVTVNRLDSDSTLTVQNGRTLTLIDGGDIETLVINNGTVGGGFLVARNVNIEGEASLGRTNVDVLDVADNLTLTADVNVLDSLEFINGRISGPGTVFVGNPVSPVLAEFSGNNLSLGTNLTIANGAASFTSNSVLNIDAGVVLELTEGTNLELNSSEIVGGGNVDFDSTATLTSIGDSSIFTEVTFTDGGETAASEVSLDVVNGRFMFDNINFTRTEPGSIDLDFSSRINIANGAEIVVRAGGALNIDDSTVVAGGGVFNLFGTLDITERGTFKNSSNFVVNSTKGAAITGGGLFSNRGMLTTVGNTVFNVLFDSSDTGSLDLSGNTLFNLSRAQAENGPTNLLRDVLMLNVGKDVVIPASVTPVAVVIDDLSIEDEAVVTFSGDGAVLLGSVSVGRESRVVVDSDAILVGDIDLLSSSSLLQMGTEIGARRVLNVLIDSDVQINGDQGRAIIRNTDIIGIDLGLDSGSEIANFANSLGEKFYRTNRIGDRDFTGTFDSILSELGFNIPRLNIENGRIHDILFSTTGISILEDVALTGQTKIINQGWLSFVGQIDLDDNVKVINTQGARLQIDTAIVFEADVENEGFLVIGENAGDVVFRSLEERQFENGPAALLVANAGTKVIVERGNLIDSFGGEENTLRGNVSAQNNGRIELLFGESAVALQTIGATGRAIITGESTINTLDENGSGLINVEGVFSGTGRFRGDTLTVGDGGLARFDRGVESQTLTVLENGGFGTEGSIMLDDLDISGTLIQTDFSGTNVITNLNVKEGGNVSLKGQTNIQTLSIAAQGGLTAQTLEFLNANIEGSLRVLERRATPAVSSILNVLSGGQVEYRLGEVFGKISIEKDGSLTLLGRTEITDRVENTINGTLNIGTSDPITFMGDVSVGTDGIVVGNLTSNLVSRSLFSQGRIRIHRVETTTGALEIFSSRDLGFRIREDLDGLVFIDIPTSISFDLDVDELVSSGALINSGAIAIGLRTSSPLLRIGSSPSGIGYVGNANSFISVKAGALITGSLQLGNGAAWQQNGNIRAGALQTAKDSAFIVQGNAFFTNGDVAGSGETRSILSKDTDIIFSQTIKTIQETIIDPLVNVISGAVLISGLAEFDNELTVEDTGQLIVGETLTSSDIVTIDGVLQVLGDANLVDLNVGEDGTALVQGTLTASNTTNIGGVLQVLQDANFDDVTVTGQLVVNGTVTADNFTVTGFAQFEEGVFNSFSIGEGATVISDNLSTTGDFVNQGVFRLGNPVTGASEFVVGGTFRQGGVFSGVGTIQGNFVQEIVSGGADAADIILNPGFSPGILNIVGNATFNAGSVFMEIGGLLAGINHDQINVTGDLLFGPEARIILDLLPQGEGGGVFIPGTGDEFILFTGTTINPDADQINLAVADQVPLGVTFVTDITANAAGDGQALRVRAFSGSNLATSLSGLDFAQQGVALALDTVSDAALGVPSPELYVLARNIQFNKQGADQQRAALTQAGATTAATMLDNSRTVAGAGLASAQRRLDAALLPASSSIGMMGSGSSYVPISSATNLNAQGLGSEFDKVSSILSANTDRNIALGEGMNLFVEGGVLFGSSDSDGSTIGHDHTGWFASAGLEFGREGGAVTAGLLVNVAKVQSDLEQDLGEVEVQAISGTIYGQYHMGRVVADAAVSYADLNTDTVRQAPTGQLSGDGGGDAISAALRLHGLAVDQDAFKAGLTAELNYADVRLDRLSETGPAALEISDVDGTATDARLSAFGVWSQKLDGKNLSFRARAGYGIAVQGDQTGTADVNFAGVSNIAFETPLRAISEDGVIASMGAQLSFESGHAIAIGYDGFFGAEGRKDHSVSVKGRYVF
jgi:hypothetical protein